MWIIVKYIQEVRKIMRKKQRANLYYLMYWNFCFLFSMCKIFNSYKIKFCIVRPSLVWMHLSPREPTVTLFNLTRSKLPTLWIHQFHSSKHLPSDVFMIKILLQYPFLSISIAQGFIIPNYYPDFCRYPKMKYLF